MEQPTVLVVDDERPLAAVLCRALSLVPDTPLVAESCATAEAALVRLQTGEIDLLVTDYCLPGMDGIALIQLARSIRPDMRTILITAYNTTDTEAAGQTLADAYITKPFSLRLFAEVVAHVLKQSPAQKS